MKRRLFSVILCAAMLSTSAYAANWPDWAQNAKAWAEQNGLSSAFLEEPEQAMTRGQTAQLFYEAAGRPDISPHAPFTDVSPAYTDAAAWASEQGLVNGVGDGRFLPDVYVTRQEFAAILYRQRRLSRCAGEGAGRLSG